MAELKPLDGPRYGPAAGGDPEQIILLLHGVGADGRDLIEIAPHLAQIFPHALFIAPNAPFRYDKGLSGYQWFSSGMRVEAEVIKAVQTAAPYVHRLIDAELAKAGLTPDRLAMVGFSQGTVMSLYVAPRREVPIAGVLGYSGRLVGPDLLGREALTRPPVFLVHGAMDPVLPIQCMTAAASALEENGFPVQTLECPGLGHSIDEQGLLQGSQFLRTVLGV